MYLTAPEARVLDSIDHDALVESLVDLVRVPSVTGTDAESELQHRIAGRLERAGLEVDAWKFDLAELRSDPRYPGEEAARTEGYGLVAQSAGEVPALVLQGHIDVVPTGDLGNWFDGDPFSGRIDGDILYGRGACDMKAGVAVNLAVAEALQASGVVLERPIAVHSVVSEEDGGLGAFATMLRGHRGDAAVVTEPTSGRLVTACAGALTFRLAVPGRAAHGSTRLEGVSAFEAYLPIHAALGELEARRNAHPHPLFADHILPFPISIGRIRAGDWASSIPDLLIAEGRLGVRLDEDPDDARIALEVAIGEACAGDLWLRRNPVMVTWPGGQFASGRIDEGHPLVEEVADAITSLGAPEPKLRGVPYGSDLRLYSALGGIPTLHFGPGDVRFAHAPREQVSVSEMIDVTRALALLAVRRCGAHF